jgi:molybdopterin-guanine dinucleotide biosynthesis protein A
MYSDIYPGQGSLGGIYTALAYSETDYVLCIACDMPFLNIDLLRYMVNSASGYDAVVPYDSGNYECLHAIYRRTCLDRIQQKIIAGNLRIQDLYSDVQTRLISEAEINKFDLERHSFMNLNTPNDVARICAWEL